MVTYIPSFRRIQVPADKVVRVTPSGVGNIVRVLLTNTGGADIFLLNQSEYGQDANNNPISGYRLISAGGSLSQVEIHGTDQWAIADSTSTGSELSIVVEFEEGQTTHYPSYENVREQGSPNDIPDRINVFTSQGQ